MPNATRLFLLLGTIGLAALALPHPAGGVESNEIPRGQNKPPGPALSPEDAIAKMKIPEGFKVECVAHEPDLINPTSFTFDDQGRIWVTESMEYPRADAGPGQDRVKIFESTHHDGKFDKMSVFADGLNIPCGVAIGNGGVYVTNSPDILFYPESVVSGKAGKPEVIVTGFGRADRHELPNSLTWGPDGWLYGMNGVFNGATVVNDGKTFKFYCAIWRWHPRTRKFELFSQGTSNPWGLDYNRQGDWFVSCCVIDHMFHMTQSGQYERQAGSYPPATHYLPSITTGRHQAAAYAGLCLYDADVFPEEYRGSLLMGNLHGSAINRDSLTRHGATYTQHNQDDFLQANDPWFMPVSQKIGPDGCLYIMDWYDRYHCYQDANRDPKGVDREHGRIYRVSYNNAPCYQPFDLQTMADEKLMTLLDNPNVWWRRTAQRVLSERFKAEMIPALQRMALEGGDKNNGHMHALWLLVSQHALTPDFHLKVLGSPDEPTRNWGVRAAGELGEASPEVFEKLKAMAGDPSADVRCQLAVAAGRLPQEQGMALLLEVMHNADSAKDPIIPSIIYSNILPMLHDHGASVVDALTGDKLAQANFGPTVVEWVNSAVNQLVRTPAQLADQARVALENAQRRSPETLAAALRETIDGFESSGVKPADRGKYFDDKTRAGLARTADSDKGPARIPATVIALWWRDEKASATARVIVADASVSAPVRLTLLKALAEQKDPANVGAFSAFVADSNAPVRLRQQAVNALGAMGDEKAVSLLLERYGGVEPQELKPVILDALVQSKSGSAALLAAVKGKRIPVGQVTENHARRIAGYNDPALSQQLASTWGTIRTDRNPERAEVAAKYKQLILGRPPGSPLAGQKVFAAKCMQCHTIYGRGGEVGPDITGVGRDNLDLLLSNVLDPNLVVGKPYYQWVVRLKNGTAANGILAEENEKQIILKDGTQRISIARADIDKMKETTLSMMPEGLEATMTEPEFIDLVSFLLLKQPPKPWSEVLPETPPH